NRIWCKVTIPILWELPFGQECRANDRKLWKKALCIRTYISCMDTQARTLLIRKGFDLSSSPPQATFDYPSFTHKLIINNLVYFISIYSQRIIGSNRDNKNNSNNELKILFREICKIIKFVESFKMTEVLNYITNSKNYLKYIDSLLKLPGSPKKLKRNDRLIKPLIYDNILNMELYLDSIPKMELLTKFINVQKRLENLSIISNHYLKFDSIFWAVISQKEKLKSLRLKSVNFYNFKGKLTPIGQFISELYIEDCRGLHESDCLFFASSFTQLSSFRFRYTFDGYPQSREFIIKILETANINLRNIRLDLYPAISFDIFSAILNYCTNVTKLSLCNLSPKQIIEIFNNNFKELRRFSFDFGDKLFDPNEILCQMAENIPKSIEIIKIKMDYDPWMFSAESLRKFFEGWCCKGGNKKIIVKCTEQARLFTLSDEYFKVIEEYGVEFNLI
ncbi:7656_t:CDS:1, partial [Diversispora eburnea]